MICELNDKIVSIRVLRLNYKCRYHKTPAVFDKSGLKRKFICPVLFHSLYPHFLARLYGGIYKESDSIFKCPAVENYVIVRMISRRVIVPHLWLLNRIKKILHFIHPSDRIERVVSFEVIELKEKCPAGFKVGDNYKIDLFNSICPASFYSIFPEMNMSGNPVQLQCPSQINRVIYEKN